MGIELLEWKSMLIIASVLSFGKYLVAFVFFLVMQAPFAQNRRVYKLKIAKSQYINEIKSSWHLIIDGLIFLVLTYLGVFRWSSFSFASLFLGFILFFIWAEVSFFYMHKLMHKNNFLYRMHDHHHSSMVPQPTTATSFSFAEHLFAYVLLWQLGMAVISHLVAVPMWSLLMFYVFYFCISLAAHSNVELFPPIIRKIIISKYFNSAASHAIHHVRFIGNYGLVTNILDRLYGSYQDDTEKLRELAYSGNGYSDLS